MHTMLYLKLVNFRVRNVQSAYNSFSVMFHVFNIHVLG